MLTTSRSRKGERCIALVEALESRQLLTATLPSDDYFLLETLPVQSNGTHVQSANPLTKGTSYFVVASGTVQIAADRRQADAEWVQETPGSSTDWIKGESGKPLVVTGVTDWGARQTDNEYGHLITGNDARLNAYFNDVFYPDNAGALTLKLYEKITLTAITGKIGSQTQTSTDKGRSISEDNVFAVPQTDGSIALVGHDLSTAEPDVLKHIRWQVVRNKADTITGIDPGIAQDATNPLKAVLNTNSVGSFNAIIYFDVNHDGKYNSGEALKVFHVAEVSVSLLEGAGPTVDSTRYHAAPNPRNPGWTSFYSDTLGHPTITTPENVVLRGGGENQALGTTKIKLGWLQDVTGFSNASGIGWPTGTYSDGHKQVWRLSRGLPLLDTTRTSPGTGGESAYSLASFCTKPVPDPAGGVDEFVTDQDAPFFSFNDKHPITGAELESVSASIKFKTYLAAYSTDYNKWYGAYLQINWSANFVFTKAAGAWSSAGSKTVMKIVGILNPTNLTLLGATATAPVIQGCEDVLSN